MSFAYLNRYRQKNNREAIGPDEFLKTPLLFKYGPGVLVLGGILLSLIFFVAANLRVEQDREEALAVAAKQSSSAAAAFEESLAETIDELSRATRALEMSIKPNGQNPAYARLKALVPGDVDVVVLDRANHVQASTRPLAREIPDNLTQFEAKVSLRPILLKETASPFEPGAFVLPLVDALGTSGTRVIYFVPSADFADIAKKLFGLSEGEIDLVAENGSLVAAIFANAESSKGTAAKTEVSMEKPKALMASTVSYQGLTVTAGIGEADAMRLANVRTAQVWRTSSLAALFVCVLAGLTAYALYNFSKKERYLRSLATIDVLTGLPNRRSFQELLATFMDKANSGQPFGLFMIDLDNFKYVNDALGHQAGDELLAQVATTLKQNVRPDARVCRLGGDEFTILIPEVATAEQAQAIGERLIKMLNSGCMVRDVSVDSRVSIGVALAPLHTDSAADLMRFADTSMYEAKNRGKGQCRIYDESMAIEADERAQTARDLARAIAHDELFLAYQPKFNADDKQLSGFEALVRWNHPTKGVVYPGAFIAIAEEAGLIGDLGNVVIRRALSQIRQWHDEGKGWRCVAVNVSPIQLRTKDFVEFVKNLLLQHRVPGECLQVELTESSLAEDPKLASQIVSQLRKIHIKVAIDDFGTGYSSLSSLQQFEIDYLKVDRSFVMQMHTEAGEEICRAIIALGHALNMRIIAEGVETLDQQAALMALQCDELQGYLLAKPVAPEKAIEYAASKPTLVQLHAVAGAPLAKVA